MHLSSFELIEHVRGVNQDLLEMSRVLLVSGFTETALEEQSGLHLIGWASGLSFQTTHKRHATLKKNDHSFTSA